MIQSLNSEKWGKLGMCRLFFFFKKKAQKSAISAIDIRKGTLITEPE